MTPTAGAPVWVTRRKWPDGPHYEVLCTVLGEDAHGVWAGSHAGTPIRLPNRSERPADYDAVFCLPRDDWFLAHFWHGHPAVEIYVDICTPPRWTDDSVIVVDLDFDVIAWNEAKGGGVDLVDADEFEQHRIALDYPEELQRDARRAAADVLARVRAGDAPFTLDVARPWLEALQNLE